MALSTDLLATSQAYRAERMRYWIHRRKVGERSTPGGAVSIRVTEVLLQDGSRVFAGTDDEVKAWLDQACLRVALANLFSNPSPELAARVGAETLDLMGRLVLSS